VPPARRLAFLLFLAFLAVPHAGLAAEPDPLGLAGLRVRLLAPELGAWKKVGTVVEVRPDTLMFMAEHQTTPALVPTASLTGLEVSRGGGSHALAGAGYGLLAGVLVGALIGGGSSHGIGAGYGSAYYTASGALIGGGVGIVAGAIIGSSRTERWVRLRLPLNP
jgi:hypothetical protein